MYLRVLALLWCLLMAELAVFLCMMLHAQQHGPKEPEPILIGARYDVPVMDYPQYRKLMSEGVVTVVRDGETATFSRSDFTNDEIKKLGLRLRAE